jgi:hypothetical protein
LTRNIFIFYAALLLPFQALSQQKCGTDYFNQQVIKKPAGIQSIDQFEEWLKSRKSLKIPKSAKTKTAEVYTIPVVFHVIHSGEDIGTGSNISEERIISQINTLNNDFRRMNEDASDTPSEFLPLAADTEIEFALAKRDPEGLPTDGIVRILGNQNEYGINEAASIASLSHWPSDEYLNIWVVDMPEYLGFAQFPLANIQGLHGLQDINYETDGVYVDFSFVGDNLIGLEGGETYQSLGRTVTHEVGHWLGLRHIWGDGGCGLDDYCNDTPSQDGATYDCPAEGSLTSCEETTMFQNYMDYTDDECMNLFTICQSDRMRTILESSPRRFALLSSQGAEEPVLVANDLGIRNIWAPAPGNCSQEITPMVEIRNYGTNVINTAQIQFLIDDNPVETISISGLSLETGQITTASFDPITSSEYMLYSFMILQVNDGTDGNSANDCVWQGSVFPPTSSIPLAENFEPSDELLQQTWSARSSNLTMGNWEFSEATSTELNNRAAKLPYYTSGESLGTLDYLITPSFNFTGIVTADLTFKYAYSNRPNNYSDALFVMVSTDCGASFDAEDIIFNRWSPNLGTTASYEEDFTPEGPGDWQEITINFGEYVNEENVVLAFVGHNGGGNNLYIDDIEILADNVNDHDAGIFRITNVPVSTCHTSFQPIVEVKNYGIQTLTALDVRVMTDSLNFTENITDLEVLPGKTALVPLVLSDLTTASTSLTIELLEPNGRADEDPSNNLQTLNLIVTEQEESIPFRETFADGVDSDPWSFVRTDALHNWEVYEYEDNNDALFFNGYEIDELGAENWFISPAIDLEELDSASLQFDISYAFREGRNDRLQIWGSSNCGLTFDELLYDKSGSELSVIDSNQEWFPDSPEDWRTETLNLSQYAGETDLNIAFVIINQNGNNIFLDNIEFFDVATPPIYEISRAMAVFPNPARGRLQVMFDFNVKEEIELRLVSFSGDIVLSKRFPNTLNQVYAIDDLKLPDGMYIIQAVGRHTNLSSKVIIYN